MKRFCPICFEKDANILDGIDFTNEKGNKLPSHYNIVTCSKCGFSYAQMEASQEVFDDYYLELNIYSEAERLRNTDYLNNPYYEFIYRIIKDSISIEDKIIDVGCGSGELLSCLRNKGFANLTGLDPSSSSIKLLNKEGFNTVCQSLFDPVREDLKHSFRLVISTMVAEHIYDLNTYVEKLTEYVDKSGGYLFVTVPDVMGFREYICDKANYFNQEHINYFSINSICNLFGKYRYWKVNDVYSDNAKEKSLYVLFQRRDAKKEMEIDTESKNSIKEYLSKYQKKENELSTKIKEIVDSNEKVVFWGSGQYAKQILNKYDKINKSLLYLVDNNTTRQGLFIGDKEIVSPETFYRENEEVMVCICSMNNAEDIRLQLLEKNPSRKIIIL